MSKSNILQIIASIIIALGVFMLYTYFTSEDENSSPLGGIAACIMGVAIIIMSTSDKINTTNSEKTE